MSIDQDIATALHESIERLYAVFKHYDTDHRVEGCPHCVLKEHGDLLESRPLRELGWPELNYYSFKALTTFGELNDFKRFLPRIFELLATDLSKAGNDPQVIAGKLLYAEQMYRPNPSISAFKESERLAIDGFLMSWWRRELAHPQKTNFGSDDDVLESLGCATGDIAPYLAAWESAEGIAPAVRLAHLVQAIGRDLNRSRPVGIIFWETLPKCAQQLKDWMRTEPPRQVLERAIFLDGALEFESDLSLAMTILETMGKT